MRTNTKRKLLISTLAMSFMLCAFGGVAYVQTAKAETTDIITQEGASIRYIPEKGNDGLSGIRFSGYVSESFLANNEGEEVGMLIIPASELGEAELTATTDNVGIAKATNYIVGEDEYAIDGYKRFTTVLYGIPDTAYGTDIVARAYVKVGESYTLADYTETRSIAQVASIALWNGDTHTTELNNYVDKAVENGTFTVPESVELMADGVNHSFSDYVTIEPNLKAIYELANDDDRYTLNVSNNQGAMQGLKEGSAVVNVTLGSTTKQMTVNVKVPQKDIPEGATLITGFDGEGCSRTYNVGYATVVASSEVDGASGKSLTKFTCSQYTWKTGRVEFTLTKALDLTNKTLSFVVKSMSATHILYLYDGNEKSLSVNVTGGWKTVTFDTKTLTWTGAANTPEFTEGFDITNITRVGISANTEGAICYLDSLYTTELPTEDIPKGATLVAGFNGTDYTVDEARYSATASVEVEGSRIYAHLVTGNNGGWWTNGGIRLKLSQSVDLTGKIVNIRMKVGSGANATIYLNKNTSGVSKGSLTNTDWTVISFTQTDLGALTNLEYISVATSAKSQNVYLDCVYLTDAE